MENKIELFGTEVPLGAEEGLIEALAEGMLIGAGLIYLTKGNPIPGIINIAVGLGAAIID